MTMDTSLTVFTRLQPPIFLSGVDLSHPPPGLRHGPGGYPSYTYLMGSVNRTGTKYVSRMGVQDSLKGLIEDLENMCVYLRRIDRRIMMTECTSARL